MQARLDTVYNHMQDKIMPNIACAIWIDAPLEEVYAIAKDNKSFPEYMNDVDSLEVVEQEGSRVVSRWVGLVSAFGLKVRWTQEDIWDDQQHLCEFRQLKGDYDDLSGTWKFREENSGTRFESSINYEYNVPGLGLLIKNVIHNLVTKNVNGALEAIKTRAETKHKITS